MKGTKPSVTWTAEGGLAAIRMLREHGNAINGDLVEDLTRVLLDVEADRSIRGALLASGAKTFCPGLDLQELVEYDRPALAAFMRRFLECVVSLYTFPRPLVAAISGAAIAGGCVLALTADWRVLRRGALIGLNEVRVGVPLPFGIAEVLRASVRPDRLEEVALLGRNYTDDEAAAAGLVHEIHDVEEFEGHCLARLEEFASKDGAAFARTKGYLRSATLERIVAGDAARHDEWLDCWFSEPTRRSIGEIVADLRRRSRS